MQSNFSISCCRLYFLFKIKRKLWISYLIIYISNYNLLFDSISSILNNLYTYCFRPHCDKCSSFIYQIWVDSNYYYSFKTLSCGISLLQYFIKYSSQCRSIEDRFSTTTNPCAIFYFFRILHRVSFRVYLFYHKSNQERRCNISCPFFLRS